MDKNTVINNLNTNVFFKIKKSNTEGVGLFAIKDIPQNLPIIKTASPIIGNHYTIEELQNLDPGIIELCQKYFEPKEQGKIFVPQDPSVISLYFLPHYFLNHSKKSNVRNENGNIITTKNIKKGEEIKIDYQKYCPNVFQNLKKTKKNKDNNKKTKKMLK
jgi:hypothetical protein